MSKFVIAIAAFAACFIPAFAAPAPPPVLAPAGILLDAKTGNVLWSHNPDQKRPIASTTKIMTSLLILESGRLGETAQVSPTAAKVEESSLNLKPGEHLTLENLLYGIIMRSANDACVAAAEHLYGDTGKFVERMNARAAELGCRNTHFLNPNGLHQNGHYSSARDLALIARTAMQIEKFRDIVKLPRYTIQRDKNKYDRALKARDHWFLTHYEGADGIKTGYTKQAGRCFVGSATRNGMQLISVLLHSPNIKVETCTLLDWGFRNYRGQTAAPAGQEIGSIPVRGGAKARVPVQVNEPLYVVLPRSAGSVSLSFIGAQKTAPVKSGQVVGAVQAVCDGKVVAKADAVALEPVGISTLRKVLRGAVALSVVGLGVWIAGATSENNRRRRRRLAARGRTADSRRPRASERYDRRHR